MAKYDEPDTWHDLPQVQEQIALLSDALAGLAAKTAVVGDSSKSETEASLRQIVKETREGSWHGPLLVIWGGHAAMEDPSTLRLIVRDTTLPLMGLNSLGPVELAELAISSGASQVLLILDTCHSGAGLSPTSSTAIEELGKVSYPPDRPPWFGAIASCSAFDRVDDNDSIVGILLRILDNGPGQLPDCAAPWSKRDQFITGQQLLLGIASSAENPRRQQDLITQQFQVSASYRPFLVNPHWVPDLEDQLMAEVLDPGVNPPFVGRKGVLTSIVQWLDAVDDGLLGIVGSAGIGKSALVKRLVALVSEEQRRTITNGYGIGPDDRLPAYWTPLLVNGRAKTSPEVVGELSSLLNQPMTVELDVLAQEISRLDPPGLVILDGLDEVKSTEGEQVMRVLDVLGQSTKVIVTTRPIVVGDKRVDEELARLGSVIDLDESEELEADLKEFVLVTMRNRAMNVAIADDSEIAAVIAHRAAVEGGFLFASLLAERLREKPIDTSFRGWEGQLDRTLGEAFENLLEHASRESGAVTHPLSVVGPLAWAQGNGLPALEIWPRIASSLDPQASADIGVIDIQWVLARFSRFIIESSEDGQAVYRLVAPTLSSYLRERLDLDGEASARIVVDLVKLLEVEDRLGDPLVNTLNPYLRRHLPSYLAQAGGVGYELAASLAERDPADFGPRMIEAFEIEAERVAADPQAALEAWARCLNLEQLVDYAEKVSSDPASRARKMVRYALAAHEALRDEEAALAAEEAFSILSKSALNWEEQLQDAGDAATIAANAYQSLGNTAQAIDIIQRLIDLVGEAHTSNPSYVAAQAWNSLGNRLADAEQYEPALEASLTAMSLYEQWLDSQRDPTIPQDMLLFASNVAARLTALGRYGEAAQIIDEALEQIRSGTNVHHPEQLYRGLLRKRIPLARELGENDGVQWLLLFVDAWLNDWLAAPTIKIRVRLLERMEASTLVFIKDTAIRLRSETVKPHSDALEQLEALRSVLDFWLEDPEFTRHVLSNLVELDRQSETAFELGQTKRLLQLSWVQIAARRNEAAARVRISSATEALHAEDDWKLEDESALAEDVIVEEENEEQGEYNSQEPDYLE